MDQCKCILHENFLLKLKGLGIESYTNSFWSAMLCDFESLNGKCWKGECDGGKEGKKLSQNMTFENRDVFWKEWEKSESWYLRLNAKNGEIEELKELVLEALPSFQEHVRIKCVKLDAVLRDQKDTGKTVLQWDFAMACSCEY